MAGKRVRTQERIIVIGVRDSRGELWNRAVPDVVGKVVYNTLQLTRMQPQSRKIIPRHRITIALCSDRD